MTKICSPIILLIMISLIVLTASNVSAGNFNRARSPKVEQSLANVLDTVESVMPISVALKMAGAIAPRELGRYLDSAYSTLDERRRAGLNILHRTADASQRELLIHLDALRKSSLASNIKSHWLTNSISVDLQAAIVDSIAARVDIKSITLSPKQAGRIIPDDPIIQIPSQASTAGVESNLTYIGADTAWWMGYTGEGRVVCVFDMTGVDGHHPALEKNWKGRDGDSLAAWNGSGKFPNPEQSWDPDTTHGTKLVSILVGHDDATGDTVGVAPGAGWIASWWPEWEWAADPDRDPNTTADMPDVINISMGEPYGCSDLWIDEIDMVEALGIVVVIAAGNSGPAPYSIWSPAARADDSLTNFAVGSIDHRYSDISWRSSRGPSSCDSISIKPNVCAPGAYIRCAIPGGSYMYAGGTSFAAPHVAGAVAILRQYAPNASVRQIKEALIAGATPQGDPYPNNTYGWGVISIPRSLAYLAQTVTADLRISDVLYPPVNICDTLTAAISIVNRGQAIDSVYLKFPERAPGLKTIQDSVYYGRIGHLDTAIGAEPLRCVFDDTLLPGPTLPVTVTLHGANGYLDTAVIQLKAGITGKQRSAWTGADLWSMEITNYGSYALFQSLLTNPPCPDPCPDTANYYAYHDLHLLIAVDSERVSDAFPQYPEDSDIDFWIDAANPLVESRPGSDADYETDCTFNDGIAENQIGIEIRQRTYHWPASSDHNFVIIEYQLHNPTSKHTDSFRVGLVSRLSQYWGPPCNPSDSQILASDYSVPNRMAYTSVSPCRLDTARLTGISVLNRTGVISFHASKKSYWTPRWMTEGEKFAALSGGIVDTSLKANSEEVLIQFLSLGPFTLGPGTYDTVAFAILIGRSPDELYSALHDARRRWKQISPSQNLPESFALGQNYPNPFNSITTIPLELPVPSSVKLSVVNILGQEVATLVDGPMRAGSHLISWNGANRRGKPVASGVYFYRIRTSEWSQTKKMLLLK